MNTSVNGTLLGWEKYIHHSHTAFWVVKAVLSIVTVWGNALVIYLISTRRRLHTTANWFILSLSLSDLLIGLLITPTELVCKWWSLCIRPKEVAHTIFNFLVITSITNLFVLALDRYLAVMKPLRYMTIMSRSRVVQGISLAWIAALVIALVPLPIQISHPNNESTMRSVILFTIIITYFFPCISLLVVYIRIYSQVRRQRSIITRQESQLNVNNIVTIATHVKKDRHMVNILGIVIMFYVLCWIPSIYRAICEVFNLCHVALPVVQAARILIALNSAINFLVYGLMKKDLKREVKKLLKGTRNCICIKTKGILGQSVSNGQSENNLLGDRSSRPSQFSLVDLEASRCCHGDDVHAETTV